MGDNNDKLPVKVEIGAKASLEIKGEIPKESMGGLVNALTDAIRPWTEARGLKADQIRLQREDVMLEIAEKARARLLAASIEPRPLSTKLLIPFLEKASLEDKDVALRDAWACLLVSATKTEQARHLTFVDILTRISSQELKLLEQVCFDYKGFPEKSYPGGHIEENRRQIEANARRLIVAPEAASISNQAKDNFVAAVSLIYGRLMHVSVRSQGTVYFYFDTGAAGTRGFQSVEILQRERLVDIVRVSPPGHGVEVGYFNVTHLGVDFVRDCSPQSDEMAARRPPPVQPVEMSKEEIEKVLAALKEKKGGKGGDRA